MFHCHSVITGPGSHSASKGDVRLLNQSGNVLVDCSNSMALNVMT